VYQQPERLGMPDQGIRPAIQLRHLAWIALALTAISGGLLLLGVPDKIQLAILFAVPGLFAAMLILMYPFVGVFLYLLFEFLRPYDLIPALLYLKVPILVIGLTTAAWLLRLSKDKRFVWTNFHWIYFGFVSLIGFTIVTADNYYEAQKTFRELVLFFLMFVITLHIVRTESRLNKLVWLMLMIHLYFALKGISNYAAGADVTGGQRTSGKVGTSFLADENDFALALNTMVPFAFFALTYGKRFLTRVFAFAVLMALVFGVVSSFSRGGWVGLVAALGYCLFRSKRRVLAFSFAAIIAVAMAMAAPQEYWQEISTISDTHESTAEARLQYWEAAVRIYLDYPVVGAGASNGGFLLPEYMTGIANPATQWGRAFHGTLPQVLAELGTIGIVLYLAMAFYVIRGLARVRKEALMHGEKPFLVQYSDAIIGGIIGYFASATFLSTAYYPQLWTLYLFAMLVINNLSGQPEDAKVDRHPPTEGAVATS
jgi:probable O-glycosylation ligase (exosortase A-associated)